VSRNQIPTIFSRPLKSKCCLAESKEKTVQVKYRRKEDLRAQSQSNWALGICTIYPVTDSLWIPDELFIGR
jgi:hypothetical protein